MTQSWTAGNIWPWDYSHVHNTFSAATVLLVAKELGNNGRLQGRTQTFEYDCAKQLLAYMAHTGNLIANDLFLQLDVMESHINITSGNGCIESAAQIGQYPCELGFDSAEQFQFLSQLEFGIPS